MGSSDTVLPSVDAQAVQNRYLELAERRGERAILQRGDLFRVFDRVARPIGPSNVDLRLTTDEARDVMARLGALVAWWPSGDATADESDWYAVICRRFTPLEEVPSKYRCEIRRGLKNCTVRQIDADYMSRNGYAVFAKAHERYRGSSGPGWTADQFRQYFTHAKGFEDINHFWGVFRDDRLIAIAANDIYPPAEAQYWMIKLDPEFLPLYPMYALLHAMNEHYLAREKIQYVNDGWRALVHQTEVQDFLVKKFAFERYYRRLQVRFRFPLNVVVPMLRPLAGTLAQCDRRLAAVLALDRFGRGKSEPVA